MGNESSHSTPHCQSKKIVKSKRKKIMKNKNNNEKDEQKEKTLTFIKNKKDAAPCTICGKVIPAFLLYFHHSLHFAEKNEIKDDTGNIIEIEYGMKSTIKPKYKYFVNSDKVLIFAEIPEEEQAPLTSNSCLICCSSILHPHYLAIGTSNPKPKSNCFLFYQYSYGNAISCSISSPTTNIPVKCMRCKEFVDKYLMELHLKNDCGDFNGLVPDDFIAKSNEIKLCCDKLDNVSKIRDKTTPKWNIIVELPKQNTISNSQIKASQQYSVKRTTQSKGSKRKLDKMNASHNGSNHNKRRRLY